MTSFRSQYINSYWDRICGWCRGPPAVGHPQQLWRSRCALRFCGAATDRTDRASPTCHRRAKAIAMARVPRGPYWPASSPCDAQLAPVAQLDRAPDYESGGRRFESFRARQILPQNEILIEDVREPAHRLPFRVRAMSEMMIREAQSHAEPLVANVDPVAGRRGAFHGGRKRPRWRRPSEDGGYPTG